MASTYDATRRGFFALIAGAALAPCLARAQMKPAVTVHKDPNCGCCVDWSEHLRRAGFPVILVDTSRLAAVRARLGVPEVLSSCHTAEVAGYVIEGHVPVAAIERLLSERPIATGLAVPGMPIGSPGMEQGPPEIYDVLLFGTRSVRRYARFHGNKEILSNHSGHQRAVGAGARSAGEMSTLKRSHQTMTLGYLPRSTPVGTG